MEKITKTDNAYQAIDKINANFDKVAGADSVVIVEGEIVGEGTTFAFGYAEAKTGTLIRLEFPDGNFPSPATSNFAKVSFGYRDTANTKHALWFVEGGDTIIENGYDIYLSPALAGDFKDFYVGIRATTGVSVPFRVVKLAEGEIKEYNKAELADTIKKAKARIVNDSCVVFPLCTDVHYRSYLEDGGASIAPYLPFATMANMAESARQIRFDNLVCLGDIIDGFNSVDLAYADAEDMMHVFSGIGPALPLLNVFGNHDDNRYGDGRLSEGELFAHFLRNVDERVVHSDVENGANWYRDLPNKKVRIIGLCAINYAGGYGYSTATQSWFTSTLGALPEGYKAIVVLHIPPVNAQTWSGSGYAGGTAIANIISANADKVIAVFEGHTHLDNVYLSPFLAVSTSSNKCYNLASLTNAPEDSVFPARATESSSEDLWDLDIVDQDNGLLSCIRFGAGVDRYIHFNPIEVAAGGNVTLTPSVITAASWSSRASESSYITIASGVATISSSAPSGTRLTAKAVDADGNMEYWCIKVS